MSQCRIPRTYTELKLDENSHCRPSLWRKGNTLLCTMPRGTVRVIAKRPVNIDDIVNIIGFPDALVMAAAVLLLFPDL